MAEIKMGFPEFISPLEVELFHPILITVLLGLLCVGCHDAVYRFELQGEKN